MPLPAQHNTLISHSHQGKYGAMANFKRGVISPPLVIGRERQYGNRQSKIVKNFRGNIYVE
jgi:hypothetical protein